MNRPKVFPPGTSVEVSKVARFALTTERTSIHRETQNIFLDMDAQNRVSEIKENLQFI